MDKQSKLKLRRVSHQLSPVVMIGVNGLTDNVHSEIDTALTAHELIKIRISGSDSTLRKQMAATICEHQDAELINTIGHVIVIYRASD